MISMDKKYRTRDGRKVRIYALDGGEDDTIHGAIFVRGRESERWISWTWNEDGRRVDFCDNNSDLFEVKPRVKRTVWLSLYPNDVAWFSGEQYTLGPDCLARVKVEIDCEEGEGL